MQIDFDSGVFLARCSFDERLAFKDAGWLWNGERRAWTTTSTAKARDFEPFATDAALHALNAEHERRLDALELSRAAALPFTVNIPAPQGLKYDPHQEVAIYYASLRRDTLCADPPGVGKTMVGVGLSNFLPDIRRVLIVPPAHLKVNWAREWTKWCVKGLTVGTARSVQRVLERWKEPHPDTGKMRWRTKTTTDHIWPDTDVVICNYDMLPDFEAQIRAIVWDLLVGDEVHYLMNEKSIRTRHTLGGGNQQKKRKVDGAIKKTKVPAVTPIPARRRLGLTGTPIMSRPIDLWPLVKAFDPNGLGRNWKSYTRRYCDGQDIFGRYDVSGASNLDELQVKLRLAFMLRRDKSILKLPPKRRQLIELPAEGLAKLVDREVSSMRLVRDALADFERMLQGADAEQQHEEEIEWTSLSEALERRFGHLSGLDYWERFSHLTPPEQVAFEEWSTARRELGVAKIPMVVEHLTDLLSSGEKVVVFVVHTEMGQALRDAFPSCAFVTGKVPSGKRQAQVDRFQEDPDCPLLVGNFVAAGTGYTMTASSHVVCAELEPVPALVEQAEDRVWRRGQKNNVLAQHLVVEGSADARLVQILLDKEGIVHEALDFAALERSGVRKDLLFAS